jgi:hypothetical protein
VLDLDHENAARAIDGEEVQLVAEGLLLLCPSSGKGKVLTGSMDPGSFGCQSGGFAPPTGEVDDDLSVDRSQNRCPSAE